MIWVDVWALYALRFGVRFDVGIARANCAPETAWLYCRYYCNCSAEGTRAHWAQRGSHEGDLRNGVTYIIHRVHTYIHTWAPLYLLTLCLYYSRFALDSRLKFASIIIKSWNSNNKTNAMMIDGLYYIKFSFNYK